jgi:hypothetical protein
METIENVSADATYSIDWNTAAEQAIATGLNEIPVVGGILSGLLEIFWPQSQADVWAEIKDKVEALIGQSISQEVYGRVEAQLGTAAENNGLVGVLSNFLGAISKTNPNGQNPQETWTAANTTFIAAGSAFQQQGYEALLLPLFAQMANLHLTLLREGVQLGFCADSELTTQIGVYSTYASQQIENATSARRQQNPSSFNYQNQLARFMQISVGNFVALWPYFDPKQYPPPVTDLPVTAEIFYTITETVGSEYSSNNYAPLGALSGDLTTIRVYWLQDTYDNYNDVEGTQLDYTSGSQGYTGVLVNGAPPPNGGQDPNNSYYTYYVYALSISPDNPIASVQGLYDTTGGTYCVDFVFADGSTSGQIPQQAGNSGYVTPFAITPPPGYRLSSIWVPAEWHFYNMAQDMVFGFRLKPSSL